MYISKIHNFKHLNREICQEAFKNDRENKLFQIANISFN